MLTSVLVVDDSRLNVALLTRLLVSQGYKVQAAYSGAEALDIVKGNLPGLVLLDIMMPGMDGYEVCRRLKADERSRDIPVIFVSALNEVFDKVAAFEAGAVDYITKPFEVDEILARVETHMTLRSLRASLEQQIAELDSFAHTVAHDLKNPLHVLLGYSEILESRVAGTQDEVLQECASAIGLAGARMVNIIEALLLLAQVRAVADVALEPLDMSLVVAAGLKRLQATIEECQAELIVAETWPAATGYGPWIEEVWVNYISNALKYGGQPPRLELGATPAAGGLVRFWVRDNGEGLSEEEQARLFTPFTRLHKVRVEGHGLGLSIVRRIVDKLGGEAGVESAVGQGSTFFFALPEVERGA